MLLLIDVILIMCQFPNKHLRLAWKYGICMCFHCCLSRKGGIVEIFDIILAIK